DEPVVLHDLSASFIDWAQGAPLPEMEGRSLRPLLSGEATSHRDYVTSGLKDWRMIYDGRHKLVAHADGRVHLFDLQNDPHEDEDLTLAARDLTARMLDLLSAELPNWPR
ncbi:MAG: sulfatase, partial [Gemmatimonadetes bacterium]|nr:sulfatase [Gemmatimonadota bacterium]